MTPTRSGRDRFSVRGWSEIAPYAALSLISFLCFAGLLVLFLWKAEKIIALGLTGSLYYVVLVPLGLAAAAFLFGALQSYARYRGRHFGGWLELGGPVVVFLLVVIGGFQLPPPTSNFTLTVYVHGAVGPQDLILRGQGIVLVDIGGLRRTAPIENGGQAIFPEVPAGFRGQWVKIGLDAAGFEVARPNLEVQLKASNVYVQVRRKAGRITGHVQDETGSPMAGVSIDVAGLMASTDTMGAFEIAIPGERLQSELTLRAVVQGYTPWTNIVVPDSNEITITMARKR